jgi:hypothetical protein
MAKVFDTNFPTAISKLSLAINDLEEAYNSYTPGLKGKNRVQGAEMATIIMHKLGSLVYFLGGTMPIMPKVEAVDNELEPTDGRKLLVEPEDAAPIEVAATPKSDPRALKAAKFFKPKSKAPIKPMKVLLTKANAVMFAIENTKQAYTTSHKSHVSRSIRSALVASINDFRMIVDRLKPAETPTEKKESHEMKLLCLMLESKLKGEDDEWVVVS